MKRYDSGTVIEVIFPFEDTNESKIRPALVIKDEGDELVVLKITSKHKGRQWDIEIPKDDFNGLSMDSVIQADRVERLKKSKLVDIIPRGTVNAIQLMIVKERMKVYLRTQR